MKTETQTEAELQVQYEHLTFVYSRKNLVGLDMYMEGVGGGGDKYCYNRMAPGYNNNKT